MKVKVKYRGAVDVSTWNLEAVEWAKSPELRKLLHSTLNEVIELALDDHADVDLWMQYDDAVPADSISVLLPFGVDDEGGPTYHFTITDLVTEAINDIELRKNPDDATGHLTFMHQLAATLKTLSDRLSQACDAAAKRRDLKQNS